MVEEIQDEKTEEKENTEETENLENLENLENRSGRMLKFDAKSIWSKRIDEMDLGKGMKLLVGRYLVMIADKQREEIRNSSSLANHTIGGKSTIRLIKPPI